MLYVEQSVYNPTTSLLNSPTSWYWNIRIGDKIQLNNTGIWYTVVGPMNVFNPELFVNVGDPGTTPPPTEHDCERHDTTTRSSSSWSTAWTTTSDGYVDNGWDGVDNDGDGIVDQVDPHVSNPLGEWVEIETWQGSLLNASTTQNIPYTITRRPVVSPGCPRDAAAIERGGRPDDLERPERFRQRAYVSERSRLPVDPTTGYVDILLNPNGTVVPTTVYSSPSSFGMNSAFYHFWLAERGDLFDPLATTANVPYLLPMVTGAANCATLHAGRLRRLRVPQGRAPADDALHPDRADHHQPGRNSTLRTATQSKLAVPAAPAGGQGGHTMKTRTAASTPRSAGITLTEILISILILGVGLVSLATLFPIGLLRLREAQRQTRSAYLFESATADVAARGLLNSQLVHLRRSAEPPVRLQPAGTTR